MSTNAKKKKKDPIILPLVLYGCETGRTKTDGI
jgi:hypothetical protein